MHIIFQLTIHAISYSNYFISQFFRSSLQQELKMLQLSLVNSREQFDTIYLDRSSKLLLLLLIVNNEERLLLSQ